MSAFVRVGRVVLLAAICCGAAFADLHSSRSASAPETSASNARGDAPLSFASKWADLSLPQLGKHATDLFIESKEALPSGKSSDASSMTVADISEKWSELQSRLRADGKATAACRENQATCSEAARRYLNIIDIGRVREGRVRLGWVNRAVNLAIRPVSDWEQYGLADFWASPLQTLANAAGDCEDYAIVKYAALRELGIPSEDLRLVVVQDDKHEIAHAVVAVRYEQRWLILDNRTMAILDAEDVRYYRPLFALDQQGTRPIATAALGQITDR